MQVGTLLAVVLHTNAHTLTHSHTHDIHMNACMHTYTYIHTYVHTLTLLEYIITKVTRTCYMHYIIHNILLTSA